MSLLNSLRTNVMYRSRAGKHEHFYRLCQKGMTVLDVGVEPETQPELSDLPARNYFLKTFRYSPECYTGLGVKDLSGMDRVFPGKRFVQYPGGRFPFRDREFDWVFSNAVIEHVGDGSAQRLFLDEMVRVGRNVFFTTPNLGFPIETHTCVPLLHWCGDRFFEWYKKCRPSFADESIRLFSYRRLRRLLEASPAARYAIYRNRFLGLTMTFTVIVTPAPGATAS
jgi:hypothetical protein